MRYVPYRQNRNSQHRIKTYDPSVLVQNQVSMAKSAPDEYLPKHKFSDFNFNPILSHNISDRNYTALTPIQDQTIPLLISGKDVVGIANTGTGKTAAFLTPFIQKAAADKTQQVLILAPTRELAVQINQEFRLFSKNLGLYSALCIG